ncbi:MAG TPA: hypothetical protein VGJ77_00630 [Gaiellaceae bacterium]
MYRPKGAPASAWPRYNRSTDADFNGAGNHGYGAYGENVAIGNLDDDPQLEIVVTFDNHQINVFNHDGTSVLASPWYTNRESRYVDGRLGWGQFSTRRRPTRSWCSTARRPAASVRRAGTLPAAARTRGGRRVGGPPGRPRPDGRRPRA